MSQEINKGYSAKEVANYFLSKHMDTGITPLKLQKLVYIAHGWHLGIYRTSLISDENVEAWQHGPVLPSLYYEFRDRGRMPINRLAEKIEVNVGKNKKKIRLNSIIPQIKNDDMKTISLLDRIWEVYGNFSGLYLSQLCHQPRSPWDLTKRDVRNAHINNDEIRKYYEERLRENQKSKKIE